MMARGIRLILYLDLALIDNADVSFTVVVDRVPSKDGVFLTLTALVAFVTHCDDCFFSLQINVLKRVIVKLLSEFCCIVLSILDGNVIDRGSDVVSMHANGSLLDVGVIRASD